MVWKITGTFTITLINSCMETTAFLYKWTQLSTRMWYIGSRAAKGCHPEDGYICSSKTVKPMIILNPNDWIRNIIAVGSPEEIISLERKHLVELDAKNNTQSFNRHNGDGVYSQAGKTPWNKGIKTNKPGYRLGATHTIESRYKMSKNMKGRVPWNKGMLGEYNTSKKGTKDPEDVRLKKAIINKSRPVSPNSILALVTSAKNRIGKPSPLKGKKMPKSQGENISASKKGIPKLKNVCRIEDRKEMNLSHFIQWCNRNQIT